MKNTILSIAVLLPLISTFSQQLTTNGITMQADMHTTTTLANFEATRKGNVVQLSWVALHVNGVASHEIQKSTNGSTFTSMGTLGGQNNGSSYQYTYLDATAAEGTNYYRLRTVDTKGQVAFSDILQMNEGFGRTDLRILGNPVRAGVLNLQLSNISAGKYFISLFNNAGERVFARSINLTDGSLTQTINLPRSLGNGLYFLEFNNGDLRINRQVMLQ